MCDGVINDVASALSVLKRGGISDDEAVRAILSKGVARESAEKLVVLVPLAFGLVLLRSMGIADPPLSVRLKSSNGGWVSLPVDGEPYFKEAHRLASELIKSGPRSTFEQIAMRSSHVAVVNDALHEGMTMEQIRSGSLSETHVMRIGLETWARLNQSDRNTTEGASSLDGSASTAVIAEYERQVLQTLASDYLGGEFLSSVVGGAVQVEHTGVGYFLDWRHPGLPAERVVLDTPSIIGRYETLEVGFVVFIENRELTLECYSWADEPLPSDVRQLPIHLTIRS